MVLCEASDEEEAKPHSRCDAHEEEEEEEEQPQRS
jgi:hypothetical protein